MERRGDGPATRAPSTTTVPTRGMISPSMIRKSVVLPHPLGPRNETNSPSAIRSETFSSTFAARCPPRAASKRWVTEEISIMLRPVHIVIAGHGHWASRASQGAIHASSARIAAFKTTPAVAKMMTPVNNKAVS